MRILIISTLEIVPWGGSEELWAGTARRLIEIGAEVMVLRREFTPVPAAFARALDAGVHFAPITIGHSPKWEDRLQRWQRRWKGVSHEVYLLDRCVRQFQPDLVFVAQAGQYDGLVWLDACRQLGLRYALMVQAAQDAWWPVGEHLQQLKLGFESADRCYFVSRGNRDLVRLQLAVALPHSEVIWNPFNISFDTPPSWPADDSLRLACVGRLEPGSKGQDLLFRVLGLPKWRDRPLSVSLFGHGASEDVLRAAATGLKSVRFEGFSKDISAVWKNHHALVLPSRVEGMPLAAIEAMMAHRLCIVTDVAGNAEIVEDNINGFVAAGPSMRALDEALERAWNRRHEWREMGLLAGLHIRSLVPSDPSLAFAKTLGALASEKSSAKSS